MSKLLFINSNKVWGGGEKWHLNAALYMQEQGHEVSLVVYPNGDLKHKAEKSSITTYEVKINNLSLFNPFKALTVYKLLSTLKPEVIFLNLPSDVKLFAPLARLAGIKHIIYRRGMPHPIKRNLINRFVYQFVTGFIANSQEIKKSIIKNYPEWKDKVKVIYNGVLPLNTLKKEVRSPIIIGNLGRLVEQKGQKHLIELATILKERNLNFKMIIGGSGPLRDELQSLISKKELDNLIDLPGELQADDFFSNIDIFVFTSYFEGSANALIESLQYGIPAVCFDISSNPEVLEDSKTGFLIDPFNISQMADKILLLTQKHDLYSEMQTNCSITIEKKFNHLKNMKQVEELFL